MLKSNFLVINLRDFIKVRNGKILFNNPGGIRVGIIFFLFDIFKIAFGRQRLDSIVNSCK